LKLRFEASLQQAGESITSTFSGLRDYTPARLHNGIPILNALIAQAAAYKHRLQPLSRLPYSRCIDCTRSDGIP